MTIWLQKCVLSRFSCADEDTILSIFNKEFIKKKRVILYQYLSNWFFPIYQILKVHFTKIKKDLDKLEFRKLEIFGLENVKERIDHGSMILRASGTMNF